jgi:glycosyltransferase involved in cell wall biosynthesis
MEEEGCDFISIKLLSKSTNPVTECRSLTEYYRAYSRLRPSAALHFTPKPNIYGALATKMLGIPCVNNIAGLGTAFIRNSWLSIVSRGLYRISQRHSRKVFFQNKDDMRLFLDSAVIHRDRAELLPGSGVDLQKFAPPSDVKNQSFGNRARKSDGGDRVRFLLIARLIWDKGIHEYVEAARLIKARYSGTEFILLGSPDHGNPSAVPEERIRGWEKEGVLTCVGRQDDVRPFISDADCVVLPSYREGTPRTLLEAAAMAKPLIAADSIGTREPVEDGETGFLCRPRDAHDLAEKMERIINMGHERREQMGWRGREKMIREYDENIVIEKYLQAIREIANSC